MAVDFRRSGGRRIIAFALILASAVAGSGFSDYPALFRGRFHSTGRDRPAWRGGSLPYGAPGISSLGGGAGDSVWVLALGKRSQRLFLPGPEAGVDRGGAFRAGDFHAAGFRVFPRRALGRGMGPLAGFVPGAHVGGLPSRAGEDSKIDFLAVARSIGRGRGVYPRLGRRRAGGLAFQHGPDGEESEEEASGAGRARGAVVAVGRHRGDRTAADRRDGRPGDGSGGALPPGAVLVVGGGGAGRRGGTLVVGLDLLRVYRPVQSGLVESLAPGATVGLSGRALPVSRRRGSAGTRVDSAGVCRTGAYAARAGGGSS